MSRFRLSTAVFAVFLLPPAGWHFTRTGQEQVTRVAAQSAPAQSLALRLQSRGEQQSWRVEAQAPLRIRYRLFLCREKWSRICVRAQGEREIAPGTTQLTIDPVAER